MDEQKKIIEAALFMSGRWMSTEDLARVCGRGSIGTVREAITELVKEYEAKDGGIHIGIGTGKYRMEIVPEVREKVYYLAPEPELSPALIKTLALIAYKQPIYQTGVVKVIGNRAYEYIRELRKKEFIVVKKKGRTRLISTTGKFNKYFSLDVDSPWNPKLGGGKAFEDAQKRLDDVIRSAETEERSNAIAEEMASDNAKKGIVEDDEEDY